MKVGNRIVLSVIIGITLTIAVTSLGFLCFEGSRCDSRISKACFWQSNLLTKIFPPGHIPISTDQGGHTYSEGTPITLFIILGGILSGIPIYGGGTFLLLYLFNWMRTKSQI